MSLDENSAPDEQQDQLQTVIVKRDTEFGVFACIPDEHTDWLCTFLDEDGLPYLLDDGRAARLAEAGCRTFLFPDSHHDCVQEELIYFGFDAKIDPAIPRPEDSYPAPFDKLLALGNPLDLQEKTTDYSLHGFTTEHVPGLVHMALDEGLHNGSPRGSAVFGPVHAWRALGQLRAKEAIVPLLFLLRRVDEENDYWVGEDIPNVLGEIGPVGIGLVATYAMETTHGLFARAAALRALTEIGKQHPESRGECVERLREQLARFATESGELNAFVICELMDLHAVEAAALIEQAFAAERVEETVCGDWEDVAIEFGLKSKREKPRRPNKLTKMREDFLAADLADKISHSGDEDNFFEPPALPYVARPKVGRNDPCPCGSKKKFKKCCERTGGVFTNDEQPAG